MPRGRELGRGAPRRLLKTLATLAQGDYFGEMSLMTGSRRLATVTAIEETRVLEVSKQSFGLLLSGHLELVEQLAAALGKRLAERAEAIAGSELPAQETQDIFVRIREFFGIDR